MILPLGMFPGRLEYPVPHLPRWGENLKASGSVLTPFVPFVAEGRGLDIPLAFRRTEGPFCLLGCSCLPRCLLASGVSVMSCSVTMELFFALVRWVNYMR